MAMYILPIYPDPASWSPLSTGAGGRRGERDAFQRSDTELAFEAVADPGQATSVRLPPHRALAPSAPYRDTPAFLRGPYPSDPIAGDPAVELVLRMPDARYAPVEVGEPIHQFGTECTADVSRVPATASARSTD